MNGLAASLSELDSLATSITPDPGTDVVICPPSPLLLRAVEAAAPAISIGAQDCHAMASGAHTGDIAADMIAETGARYVIVGHSERRAEHHETDAAVCAKVLAAVAAGLTAIVCIGESEAERAAGSTLDVLATQLAGSLPDTATPDNTVIAYEPIWAIGTGKVASFEDIVEVHDFLRGKLNDRFGAAGAAFRLLYGGSVKAGNAASIFQAENVDGALVGGASLKAADFAPIVEALTAS